MDLFAAKHSQDNKKILKNMPVQVAEETHPYEAALRSHICMNSLISYK